jgi:hypothetical protein
MVAAKAGRGSASLLLLVQSESRGIVMQDDFVLRDGS